jgi:hypothetical protein
MTRHLATLLLALLCAGCVTRATGRQEVVVSWGKRASLNSLPLGRDLQSERQPTTNDLQAVCLLLAKWLETLQLALQRTP